MEFDEKKLIRYINYYRPLLDNWVTNIALCHDPRPFKFEGYHWTLGKFVIDSNFRYSIFKLENTDAPTGFFVQCKITIFPKKSNPITSFLEIFYNTEYDTYRITQYYVGSNSKKKTGLLTKFRLNRVAYILEIMRYFIYAGNIYSNNGRAIS